jgi:predicted nucleic acid-binding protein
LVYCFDGSAPEKRARARDLLRQGAIDNSIRHAHQGLIEFVQAVTRARGDRKALLSVFEATLQVEGFMAQFSILYPNDHIVRLALLGMATYRLPWSDAHMWAYAEHYGLREIISEDFQHGQLYGTVRIQNPFIGIG